MSTFNFSPSSSAKGSSSNPRRRSPLSSLAQPALGAALAIGVLTAGQAQAVVVNVPGYGTWDVTTFTGSYNDYSAKFNFMELGGVMPWWVEEPAALAFDAAVGASLGDFDLNGGSRPIFGYQPPAAIGHPPHRCLGGDNSWQSLAELRRSPLLSSRVQLDPSPTNRARLRAFMTLMGLGLQNEAC